MLTPNLHKKGTEKPYSFAIYTISTSRYEKYGSAERPERAEDVSGKLIWDMLDAQGHKILRYALLPDDFEVISRTIKDALYSEADMIITSGGTGLTPKDLTIEAVAPLLEKEMPGFGELFRHKSFSHIGNAAMLTRALGGVARGKGVFCLPGSPNAAKVALELLVPEIGHIVKHARAP
jgi:molybdenum cofactor biosynthesis protein B